MHRIGGKTTVEAYIGVVGCGVRHRRNQNNAVWMGVQQVF